MYFCKYYITALNSVKATQTGRVTHSAHSWSEVLPAQLKDGQRAVAGHLPDVVTETIRSCGQRQTVDGREDS